jgi:hypothetical protein
VHKAIGMLEASAKCPKCFRAVRIFPTMRHPQQGIECRGNPFNMGISDDCEKLHR